MAEDNDIKNRVGTLETVLGDFIVQTNKTFDRLEKDMREFKDEMRGFKDGVNDFKDEMRGFKEDMSDFKEEMRGFKDEMLEFKNEMRDFKDEMYEFKEESRADRKAMNKRWGDLANKMGTVAEDIAAPNIRAIAKVNFQEPNIEWYGVRQERRHPTDKAIMKEYDVILATPAYVFVNETKSHPKPEDIPWFVEKCNDFFTFYPEMEGKKLILVYASLALPENMIRQCTKQQILALAMGEETMELQNPEVVNDIKSTQ